MPILATAALWQQGLGLHVCRSSGIPSLRARPCPCGPQDPLQGQTWLHGLPRGTLCSGARFKAVASGPRSTSPYISMKGERRLNVPQGEGRYTAGVTGAGELLMPHNYPITLLLLQPGWGTKGNELWAS